MVYTIGISGARRASASASALCTCTTSNPSCTTRAIAQLLWFNAASDSGGQNACGSNHSSRAVVRESPVANRTTSRSEEHTSELQSRENLVCRLLLEKKKHSKIT